jgi:peptide/nickel transport system ATP-binding protein
VHPYTRALLAASPRLVLDDEGDRPVMAPILGAPPSPLEDGPGCSFAPRCAFRFEACVERPPLRPAGGGGVAACWLADA